MLTLATKALGIVLSLLLAACSDVPDASKEIVAYLKTNNTLSVPLSVLAKHPVTRVCLLDEYKKVNDVAGLFGFDIPGYLDEGESGLLMMNDKQATARRISRDFMPGEPCVQGSNIQLKLVPLDPAFKWQDRMDVERAVRLHMRPHLVAD